MTPRLEQALKQLIATYGIFILSEPKRLQSMLHDLYNGNRREIRLMITAAEERIVAELLAYSALQIEKPMFNRLASKFHYHTGIEMALIEGALASWIRVLDKIPPPCTERVASTVKLKQPPVVETKGHSALIIPQEKQATFRGRVSRKKAKDSSMLIMRTSISLLALAGVIKLYTSWFEGDSAYSEELKPKGKEEAAAVDTDEAANEESSPPTPDLPKEEPSISYETMRVFMEQYNELRVQAINTNNFSLLEPLLDRFGKGYTEQSDYIAYLNRRGIQEQIVEQQVRKVIKLDSKTYEVRTYEVYNIYYSDGTKKRKSFNSSYTVRVTDGRLAVNALIESKQVANKS